MTADSTVGVKAKRFDKIDRRILKLLQDSGRISNRDLAKQVNLSPTPCLRRVGILEQAGVIERYKAVVDAERAGYTIRAFVQIIRNRELCQDKLWNELLSIPEVISCHVVSGDADLLLEIVARDMQHYSQIFLERLSKIEGVYDLRSNFSIKALKVHGALPIQVA